MIHLKIYQFHPLYCILIFILDNAKFLTINVSINTLIFYSKNDFISYHATNVLKYLNAQNTIYILYYKFTLSLSLLVLVYVQTFHISLENTYINSPISSLYFIAYNKTHLNASPLHLNNLYSVPAIGYNLSTNFINSIHDYKLSSKCGCKSY